MKGLRRKKAIAKKKNNITKHGWPSKKFAEQSKQSRDRLTAPQRDQNASNKLLHAAKMSLKAERNKINRVRQSDLILCVSVVVMVPLLLLLTVIVTLNTSVILPCNITCSIVTGWKKSIFHDFNLSATHERTDGQTDNWMNGQTDKHTLL